MTLERLAALGTALVAFLRTLQTCFRQQRTAEYLPTYCRGLLSDLPRKTVEAILVGRPGKAVLPKRYPAFNRAEATSPTRTERRRPIHGTIKVALDY